MGNEKSDRRKENTSTSIDGRFQELEDRKLWIIFIFGLIGATATAFAVHIINNSSEMTGTGRLTHPTATGELTTQTPSDSLNNSLSHHYSVLGLDRLRTNKYTDEEIKTAFRAQAKEYHPDQNQENKDAAEAKFEEILSYYEAIKRERKHSNY